MAVFLLCRATAPKDWTCPNTRKPGERFCEKHKTYHREYMREYRKRFRAQRQEANERAVRNCVMCQTVKPRNAFYLPRKKIWMEYKEFYWTMCKDCHRAKISESRRQQIQRKTNVTESTV